MKSIVPLLLASLSVNAGLGVLIARRSPDVVPSGTMANAGTSDTSAPGAGQTPPAATAAGTVPAKAVATAAKVREPLWAGLNTDSVDEAIVRLKSAGCPPREIVFVIRSMIQEKMMERRQALGYASETLPYWQAGRLFNLPRPANEMNDVYQQSQRLERQYLLTPEFFGADEAMVRMFRERFGPFDHETLRRLALLDSERNEKGMQLTAAASSTLAGSPAQARDPKLREQLQADHEAAVQALLTPEQYVQYALRNGPTALQLRYRLANFDPTEDEYLALFAIEKARQPSRESARQQTPEQRKAAEVEYQAAVQAALGPERGADFEALQKAGSDMLPRLLVRLNLPLRTITTINAVRDDSANRARAIRENPQLTPDQRSAQLNALAAEAEADLGALLGTAQGLEAYKDIKGEWLRNLRHPPPPGR